MNTKTFFSKDHVTQWGKNLVDTIRRYPVTLFMIYALATLAIYRLEAPYAYGHEIFDILDRWMLTLLLGFSLSLLVEAFWERMGGKLWTRLISIGVLAVFLLVYQQEVMAHYEQNRVLVRHFLLIVANLFAFSVVPYFLNRKNYSFYVVHLMARLIETLAYTVVLGLGFTAILFAIQNLLYSQLNDHLYAHFWIFSFAVFAVTYFLSGIPKLSDDVGREEFGKVLKGLFLYIILPLLSVYSVVLYAYFFRILFQMDWPSGMVSYLVIFSSAIGMLSIFVLYPISKESRWCELFVRWYPRLVLPLLAMMFVAIVMRINQYGITENRYFILLGGIWVTFGYLYFNIRRGKRHIVLVLVLVILLLLSGVGPLSAFDVSMRSQNNRFEQLLRQYDMLDEQTGKIQSSPLHKTVEEGDLLQLYEIADYFSRRDELGSLRAWPLDKEEVTQEQWSELLGGDRPQIAEEHWAFYFQYVWNRENRDPIVISNYDLIFGIAGYQQANGGENLSDNPSFVGEDATWSLGLEDDFLLTLRRDQTVVYQFDLQEYAEDLYQQNDQSEEKYVDQDMRIEEQTDDVRVMILITRMGGNMQDGGVQEVELDCLVDIL